MEYAKQCMNMCVWSTRAIRQIRFPGRTGLVLHDYFAWATTTTMSRYHDSADDVPEGLTIPRWSWDGLQR